MSKKRKKNKSRIGLFFMVLFDIVIIGVLAFMLWQVVKGGAFIRIGSPEITAEADPVEHASAVVAGDSDEAAEGTEAGGSDDTAEGIGEDSDEAAEGTEADGSDDTADDNSGGSDEMFEDDSDGMGLAEEDTVCEDQLEHMSGVEVLDEEEIQQIESEAAVLAASADTNSDPYAELPPTKRCLVDGSFWEGCPTRDIQLLTPNPYSRPQYQLEVVHDIVIHYVGNEGSTAQQNRDYFESLKDGSRSASSHFVVGLEGEIIQCISCSEWSYASNDRNWDTISIECCHPDASGKFNDETYISVVNLTAWLCKAFEIGPEHVIRHHDVTGKDCPLYFVEHPEAWEAFKEDVKERYNQICA